MNLFNSNKTFYRTPFLTWEKLNRCLICVLFFGCIISCQNVEKPEAPENLISETEMVNILTESYLMNASRSTANRTLATKGIKLDSILFKKYAIDSLQFAQSNAYYSTNLNAYKEIFTKVEENIQLEKTKRDTLYARFKRAEEEKRIQDSIANVQDSLVGLDEDEDVDKLIEEQKEEERQDSINALRGSFVKRGVLPSGAKPQDSLL